MKYLQVKMNRFFCALLIVSSHVWVCANDFLQTAPVDSILQDGFTRILLSPQVVAGLKSNNSDIRIYDSGNQEVPYLLFTEEFVSNKTLFREMSLLENSVSTNQKLSRIVLHNTEKKTHSTFIFYLRAAEVQKEMILKGSNDQKNWFIITHATPDVLSSTDDITIETRQLRFPPANYEYFEVTIPNPKKDPVQILKAGYCDLEKEKGFFSAIPLGKLTQKDSLKSSFIRLVLDHKYLIHRLLLRIEGSEIYQRNCLLKVRTGNSTYIETFSDYTLSSKQQPVWEFAQLRADTLYIEIENGDNAPLKITSAEAFQLNTYLIAKLKKDEDYRILYGNTKATLPDYDLKYFTDSIPENIPEVGVGMVSTNDSTKMVEKQPFLLFNSRFLWAILVLVIGSLTFLSVRILKEMKKKE